MMSGVNGVKGLAAGVLGMFKSEDALEDVEERSEEGESKVELNGTTS
jgi:hypothetical protein